MRADPLIIAAMIADGFTGHKGQVEQEEELANPGRLGLCT